MPKVEGIKSKEKIANALSQFSCGRARRNYLAYRNGETSSDDDEPSPKEEGGRIKRNSLVLARNSTNDLTKKKDKNEEFGNQGKRSESKLGRLKGIKALKSIVNNIIKDGSETSKLKLDRETTNKVKE